MGPREAPLVSILCITYNHEAFLAKALDSFLAQRTSFSYEIVVGDDCSSDSAPRLLAEYADKNPGLIRPLWSSFNMGMVANFRRTLEACRGKYIALCEGDDYWLDCEKLQKQVEFLEANPSYVLSYHDAYTLREGVVEEMPQLGERFRKDASGIELMEGRQISTLTVCCRNVIKSIPSTFDGVPVFDMCFWSMLGEYGAGKFQGEVSPAIYRMHAGGVMSLKTQEAKYRMTLATFGVLSMYWERRGRADVARRLCFKAVMTGVMQLSLAEKLRVAVWSLIAFAQRPVRQLKRIFA